MTAEHEAILADRANRAALARDIVDTLEKRFADGSGPEPDDRARVELELAAMSMRGLDTLWNLVCS